MDIDFWWFNELRKLDRVRLNRVAFPERLVPSVEELTAAGALSRDFLIVTLDLVKAFLKTNYPLDISFRAYERQITNYTKDRAFRKQWNIGFSAGENSGEDYVRKGRGTVLLPAPLSIILYSPLFFFTFGRRNAL